MTTFLDIVPNTKKIKTSFGEVDVPGLSIEALVIVFRTHPELLELFQQDEIELTFTKILDMGLGITSSVIAAGLGYPGDEQAIDRAKKLKPDDALKLGIAIFEESFPSGPKSFFDQVLATAEKVGGSVNANLLKNLPASASSLSPKGTETSSPTPPSS